MVDPDVFSFATLWRHYRRCRRHKRRSANALAFELDAEANLLALQSELRARTYQPGRSVCFITEGPKPREVFAADFRDRIVHTCSLRIRSAYSSRCSFTMPTPAGWARARSPRATD